MTPEPAAPAAVVHQGEALAVLTGLPAGSVDAVIADPPYCSGGRTSTERKRPTRAKYTTGRPGDLVHELRGFVGDSRDQRSWTRWCALWLAECYRVTVTGGSVLMFCDWRQYPAASDALQAAGWTWRGEVTWVKSLGHSRPVRAGFRAQCEFALWGVAEPLRRDHEVYLPGAIMAHAPRGSARSHPTEKPESLMRTLVQVAPPGGLVVDPFAGSSTTGVAAVAEGRRFLGVELDPEWATVARDRIAQALAAPPLA